MKEVEHLANKERDSIELVETNIENWTYIHQVEPITPFQLHKNVAQYLLDVKAVANL